ncbi:MAG: hypothetical protein AAGF67_08865 [Verrucomicrobiota bacterium]
MTRLSSLFYPVFFIVVSIAVTACEKAEQSDPEPGEVTESPASAGIQLPESGQRPLTAGEQKVVVDQLLKARAKQQAEGLGSGGVRVNGAWDYRGYSYLSPNPDAAIEARLVAVDITISGHTEHFDLDDVEIVDGASLMSYGSDPHATALTLDGEILPADKWPDAPPKASRWLLIYAYPKQSPAFHLYYWGRALTTAPVPFKKEGLELPFPPAVPTQDAAEESG